MPTVEKKGDEVFSDKLIKKEYINKLRNNHNIPHYVIENIIHRSEKPPTDPDLFSEMISGKLVDPKKSASLLSKIRGEGTCSIIDKLKVKYFQSNKKYLADCLNLGINRVLVEKELIRENPCLLEKEQWCEIKIKYLNDVASPDIEFALEELILLQGNSFDFKDYVKRVASLDTEHWLDLLFRSIGLEIDQLTQRQSYLLLARLIPFVEKNYNLIELGYRGTGKSYLYRQMTDDSILVSGGKTTIANMFYNLGTRQIGLVGRKNVIAFDEVAHVNFKDSTAVQIMKDYMESGSFSRGSHDIYADSSIVLLGNINEDIKLLLNKNVFTPLPELLRDMALIDRLNFYLPGWEINKLLTDCLTGKNGLLDNYLFAAFNRLRDEDYTEIVEDYFQLDKNLDTRDSRSVKKTVAGYIKLLHPDGNVSKARLKNYLELALEGRKRIKDYLVKFYPFEYSEQLFECAAVGGSEKVIPSLPEDKYNYQLKQKLPEPGVIYIGQIINNNELAILKVKIKSYSYGKGRLSFVNTYDKEIMKQLKKSFVNIKGKSTEIRKAINQRDFHIEFIPLLKEINADISKAFFVALYSLIYNKVITTSFIISEKSKLFRESFKNQSIRAIKIEEKGKLKTLLPIKTDDFNLYIEIPREVYENVHDYILLTE
ncbi:BREX system Lon protease-like protein BrxL [Iocasia frigidifontis]|uniref:BREX system Lon protease-like protein BrxL n=1 Tax=Iocasia fonsfrigidae TaxID=2682810 RepID=A0A8A7KIB2_9FIRM|nr:BREX system Lon protease-like protein BrxL [Iocasia fonsfrigidae]QTL98587.1 BREX system Lon protease-like protein BrxL [Iocasia fonsfrigidae]